MSIARLQASLAQATNEVTVAAANINFDFCLVKYEAPKEYQPVAKFLSAGRKQDAEQGKSHATARRLAALFEGVCPETKSLIKAYGQRVSEISKQATDQESKQYSASLFSSYIGIDATSIWAAATSSESEKPSAIQVHLLACMLAAMFEASKAISVWVELVDGQRKAIARSWENEESIPFSAAAAAAQQDISRAQLAEWDASARAWLQTADSVMVSKQTQLRLILKNVQLSIGTDLKVYPGVIEAWKKTLRTVDRLVSGIPQEVQDGSAILGLAAWHIYPDINVFGSRNVEVYMKDQLVAPGGVLSLGCSPSVSTSASGVSWSLSLAQLRYYGQPVTTKGSFQSDPTRITFKELMLVTLGCILSRWNVAVSPEQTREAIQIISLLSKSASSSVALAEDKAFSQSLDSSQCQDGAKLLFEATRDYFADGEMAMRFINLGQNRTQFLPAAGSRGRFSSAETRVSSRLRPFFGLEIPGVLVSHLKDGGGRVELLRRMAKRATGLEEHVCIIQYTEQKTRDQTSFNYATVFSKSSEKYGGNRTTKSSASGHSRWLQPGLERTVAGREAAHANDGYSIYGPSGTVKLICTHKPGQKDESSFEFWYGDPDCAAIYVQWNSARPRPPTPKVGRQDLLWCLEHDLLTPDVFSFNHTDNVSKTLNCLASASRGAFESIPGPVIHVQVLEQPFLDATCVKSASNSGNPLDPNWRLSAVSRTVSILSYLVAGYDIPASKIPGNIVGISMGDSIFVPQKLLCDPMKAVNGPNFTRILGNIGKPGFVMFFSVDSPVTPPQDCSFWRVANPQQFDGSAADLFGNTSMHLSFTNWERPLEGFSSRGIHDIQISLMECVISIRERGKWIGDVDVIPAMRSPVIYQLPRQTPCEHSKPETPGPYMKSIESWDELREHHSGNVVVRASGNWLARLATTSYLAQCAGRQQGNIGRITLCPAEVCWKCLGEYVEQFSPNIYIF